MMIAALLLPFALLQGEAAVQAPSRFEACVAAIDADAVAAYEEAMAWAAEAQSLHAYRCAAMAMVGQNRFAEGARRFESLATALSSQSDALRDDPQQLDRDGG